MLIDTVSVPIGIPHKVANISNENVVIIETGIGEILSENDFMRVDTDISDVGLITDLIKLEPAYKDNLWGGTKLRTIFGKKCDYDIIGESWELSAHPDGQSIIANGIYKGMYFGEFIEKAGNEILGWKCGSFDRFPILIKFIDARQHCLFRYILMMNMHWKLKMSLERMKCGMLLIANREHICIAGFPRILQKKK